MDIVWNEGTPEEYLPGMLVKLDSDNFIYCLGDIDAENVTDDLAWSSGCGCCSDKMGNVIAWSKGVSDII